MKTRQPVNSSTRVMCSRDGHHFELTFRPDQRVVAWLAVEHWWNQGIITYADYLTLRNVVRANTWEEP